MYSPEKMWLKHANTLFCGRRIIKFMRITLDPFLRMLHSILPGPLRAFVPEPEENNFQHEPTRTTLDMDESSMLAHQSRRYSYSPTEELQRMSPRERERLLEYLYGITTEVMRRDNPRAEADMLHIAESRDPLAGVARQMYANMYLLFEMSHTDDPAEFGRIIHVYLGRVFEKIAYLIEEGPANLKKVSEYAKEIFYGPTRYIQILFERKFIERMNEGDQGLIIVHNDMITMFQNIIAFENEKYLSSKWNEAAIEKLASMHKFARGSPGVYAHALSTALPYVIVGTLSGIDIDVQIDKFIRYRDGLDSTEIGLLLRELVHNGMKYRHPKKSERYVRIRWDGEKGAIVIEDNGRGIKDTDVVWKLGQREANRNPDVAGTGVGLPSVRRRIEKLGWAVELMSKVNKGTTFRIYPAKGDIVRDESGGSGNEEGGGGKTGLSPSDVDLYAGPRATGTFNLMAVGANTVPITAGALFMMPAVSTNTVMCLH